MITKLVFFFLSKVRKTCFLFLLPFRKELVTFVTGSETMSGLVITVPNCTLVLDAHGKKTISQFEVQVQSHAMHKTVMKTYNNFFDFDQFWRKDVSKDSLTLEEKKKLRLTGKSADLNPFISGLALAPQGPILPP